MRRGRMQCPLVRNSFYPFEPGLKQRVCLPLDPIGDDGVRRSAVWRVVFESTVMRGIVRGRDDNPVSEPSFSPMIVGQDCMGNHRGRGIFVSFGEHHLDAVCRQDLQRGGAGWNGERVGVDAHIQRAGDFLAFAIQANRLGDREDVPFIESQLQRRTSMTGGAKRHSLFRYGRVGDAGVVGREEPRHIY